MTCGCHSCREIARFSDRLEKTQGALKLLLAAVERYQKTNPGDTWPAAHRNLERKKTFARMHLAPEPRKA